MPLASKRLVLQHDQCLILQPELVKQLGRSAAILLQQLHYWISANSPHGVLYQGKRWIYNTYDDWEKQLKIVSVSTIRRSIKKLEENNIILSSKLGKKKSDQTKWYTINYEILLKVIPNSVENNPMIKMNSPTVQNEQIINKEAEITSENKLLSSEKERGEERIFGTQQVNPLVQESELKNKNNLATELLEVWNQTVGQGSPLVQLTKKRAQHLVAAFRYRFQSSLKEWEQFCQQVTTSDFLMGKVKETFRASLDWVLKFDTIQRILEGDFGVKVKQIARNQNPSGDKIETISAEIDLRNETVEVKHLRQKILYKIGEQGYHSWFEELKITFGEQGRGVFLQAQNHFIKEYLETHYMNEIRSLTSQVIHIFCG